MAKNTATKKVVKYSKEQLAKSQRYIKRRDLLEVLLEDSERYSFEEVDAKLSKYMKGKVN